MNLLAVLQGSARIGLLASAIPVAAGLMGFRARSVGFRLLWIWVAFGFGLNVVMMVLADHGRRTSLLFQLTLPAFAVLGLLTTSHLTNRRVMRRWCLIGAIGYLVFWGWRFLNNEAASDFSLYTGPVLWMLLSLSAAAVIGVRLSELPSRLLRDPILLAGMAILASYAPSAAIEPVSATLYLSHRDLTLALWICRTWLVIVGYFLFSLAFLWTLPSRLSPGSSSSAA